MHQRFTPKAHQFAYGVSHVWVDPDRPEDLTDHHPLWSSTRPAPARFRYDDYGSEGSHLGDSVRAELAAVLGYHPTGEIRMLTQLRRWGWLFNPITLYFVWDRDNTNPIGGVLEVTNTPWKERHRYPIALETDGNGWTACFPKALHVSPFLDEAFEYRLTLDDDETQVGLSIDVHRPDSDEPTVSTRLELTRVAGSRRSLGRALRSGLPTHLVSLGIHVQALRLAAKRVPFVAHPKKSVTRSTSPSDQERDPS